MTPFATKRGRDRREVQAAGWRVERASASSVGGERRARGGSGRIAATARATGMAVDTIRKGMAELESGERLEPGRVRMPAYPDKIKVPDTDINAVRLRGDAFHPEWN